MRKCVLLVDWEAMGRDVLRMERIRKGGGCEGAAGYRLQVTSSKCCRNMKSAHLFKRS